MSIDFLFAFLQKVNVYLPLNYRYGEFPDENFGMSWLTQFSKSLHLYFESLSLKDINSIRNAIDRIFILAKEIPKQPIIAEKFTLGDVIQAHKFIVSGGPFGKVPITI